MRCTLRLGVRLALRVAARFVWGMRVEVQRAQLILLLRLVLGCLHLAQITSTIEEE